MIASILLFNNMTPINTVPCLNTGGASARLPESPASPRLRGDMHLGRSKTGEKSSLSRAGVRLALTGDVDDVPYPRTPVLPKADHPGRMARNPPMTAAK